MQTECSAKPSEFAPVEGRPVVAEFDGGAVTSDAGGLLLGAADKAIGLVGRLAGCFRDARDGRYIEHTVATLVGQRVFGIALGYEDLNDHDDLRHDPLMSVLAGKLEAWRPDCAPVAGKSTLNRLELSRDTPTKYRKIAHDPAAIEGLFVDLFLEAHAKAPKQITLDLDATDDPLHGDQEGRFFHAYYDCYCYLPLYVFCGRHLLAAKLRPSNIDGSAGAKEEIARIVAQIRSRWPRVRICCAGIPASAAADNADGALFANAYAQVHFNLPGDPNVLRLAATALLPADKGVEVATLGRDNKVTLKNVQLGRDFGDSAEISSGLSRDDKIIDSPPETLLSGQEVRVSAEDSTLSAGQTASRTN